MLKTSLWSMLLLAFLFACSDAKKNETSEEPTTDSLPQTEEVDETEEDLKAIALRAQDALFKEYSEEGVKQYFKADYIQHNPNVPTGIDPILKFLPALKEAQTTYTNHRLLQDGNFIVFHNTYDNAQAFGAKQVVTFDIWRMENGQVAEHWDCIQPFDPEAKNKSGRTVIDGTTEITDLDKTEENKKLVQDFYQKVFVEKKKEEVDNYVSAETYIQHSAGGKDGIEGFKKFINFYINDEYVPAKIHRVLGEGNFVLVQAQSVEEGNPSASYDLFRVEDGKIVEHWDILQQIPEKMLHDNGMF